MIYKLFQRGVGKLLFLCILCSDSSDENYENSLDKHDFKIKIKTEVNYHIYLDFKICKYWREVGFCPFGMKVMFFYHYYDNYYLVCFCPWNSRNKKQSSCSLKI